VSSLSKRERGRRSSDMMRSCVVAVRRGIAVGVSLKIISETDMHETHGLQ
jgi:hypothetical protein